LRLTEQFSVITQLENLLTYPSVQRRVKSGAIRIHGWYYDIASGHIEYYDPEFSLFQPLSMLEE
jgi:carbonic anhydrase